MGCRRNRTMPGILRMIALTNLLLFLTTLSLIIMGGLLLTNWFTNNTKKRKARRNQRDRNQRIAEINAAAVQELMDRVAILETKVRKNNA